MNKYKCKENLPHVTTNQIRISYGRKVARFFSRKIYHIFKNKGFEIFYA